MSIGILFPEGIYPDVQRLTGEAPGQELQESEWTGAQNVVDFVGYERWKLSMTFADLVEDPRATMKAFVTKLRVSRNSFVVVNHTAPQRGVLSGTPMAHATPSGASALTLGNLAGGNVSSWAREGDFVSVNCELKMVLQDAGVVSNVVSLQIWPPVRMAVVSGTIVHANSPCGQFRLERATTFDTSPPGYKTSMVLEAVERINSSMVVIL
jgi:hypothetical protein